MRKKRPWKLVIGTSDVHIDLAGPTPGKGQRSWRWLLSLGFFYLHLNEQFKWTEEVEWDSYKTTFFHLDFRPLYWKWGYFETYCDGMYRSFSFGPFHINWFN